MDKFSRTNFKTDIGQKADVQRHRDSSEEVKKCNEGLRGIGEHLKETQDSLREVEYLGSIAVHYYKSPVLGHPFFITQTSTLDKTPEALVQEGITELRNECLIKHGHSPQYRRSGI